MSAFLQLLRPKQWVKNVFVFAGLVFGRLLLDSNAIFTALLGFACLCALSSTIYIFNDIHDREEDRLHPRKCKRPIAAGRISVPHAAITGVLLGLLALAAAWLLDRGFFLVALSYVILQTLYTLVLKHIVLLDVIAIGAGFVLRAVAGAVLVHVEISHWLVVCTFTLCLFMGFSKRRCELSAFLGQANGGDAGKHRRTLTSYTVDLLNQMTTLTAGIAVVSFMLYATDERTLSVFKTHYLVYTLPLVVYAVFRFALLVEHGRVDGPDDVMLRDPPFQAAMLLWTLSVVVLVYWGADLERTVNAYLTAGRG